MQKSMRYYIIMAAILRIRKAILFALFPILLSSCLMTMEELNSDDVQQSEIYQKLEVSVNEDSRKISTRAAFFEGGPQGNPLRLGKKSKILINGQKMKKVQEESTLYKKSMSMGRLDAVSFEYTNANSDVYSNKAEINPFVLADFPKRMSSQTEVIFHYLGQSLDNDTEGVYAKISFINPRDGLAYTANFALKSLSAKRVSLASADLALIDQYLDSGGAMELAFQFVRETREDLEEATNQGGEITTRFQTKFYRTLLVKN